MIVLNMMMKMMMMMMNAPQGVEKVHSECRIDSESYDQGNDTLWSALISVGKALYKNQLFYYDDDDDILRKNLKNKWQSKVMAHVCHTDNMLSNMYCAPGKGKDGNLASFFLQYDNIEFQEGCRNKLKQTIKPMKSK